MKKQLNRSVEVIKIVDYTDVAIHMKELMFVKVSGCSEKDIEEIFRISQIFNITVIDYNRDAVLIESVKTENNNNDLIALLGKCFANRIEIVRGGSVAVEALSIPQMPFIKLLKD